MGCDVEMVSQVDRERVGSVVVELSRRELVITASCPAGRVEEGTIKDEEDGKERVVVGDVRRASRGRRFEEEGGGMHM